MRDGVDADIGLQMEEESGPRKSMLLVHHHASIMTELPFRECRVKLN